MRVFLAAILIGSVLGGCTGARNRGEADSGRSTEVDADGPDGATPVSDVSEAFDSTDEVLDSSDEVFDSPDEVRDSSEEVFDGSDDVGDNNDITVARCPVARITVSEGAEVPPPTTLHLSGHDSTAAVGEIAEWIWSVDQPGGSVGVFLPSSRVSDVTFEVAFVGEYVFRLEVRDTAGNLSCEPAEYTVSVDAEGAIHVELSWSTPGDIDEPGEAVADVNIHFLHPKAGGRYFDSIYDCWRGNPMPEWGIFSPADNPVCDERHVTVKVPEQGVRYQVGVHMPDDAELGSVYATVRIYLYGVLRDVWSDVKLNEHDMWDTHYIDWPSGIVTRIGSDPHVTPNYPR